MWAAKTSFAASTVGAARGSDGIDPDMGIGDGWLAILLNASRVALIVVYMQHGEGLSNGNLARLYEALSFAKAAKRWPVLVCDWNFEPSALRDFIGLSEIKLKVIQPSNADLTCLQGRGALTSSILVADEVAASIDSYTAVTVAWGTHLGLRLHMKGARGTPWYRALD